MPTKLTAEQVRRIRQAYATGKVRQKILAMKYSTTVANISYIVNRKTWKDVK